MPQKFLCIVLLIEGFVTISVEILGIRQLVPFAGSNVIITSLVIGIFLLFLSIGYWRGGQHRQDYKNKLSTNFIVAAGFIGIGLSFPFISLFFVYSYQYFSSLLLLQLSVWLFLTIAPIVYLLGQTIPLTSNLFKDTSRVSTISGNSLFINTLGSFLGAIITSTLLLNYLGVATTVFINTLLLVGLSFYLSEESQSLSKVVTGLVLIWASYVLNLTAEHRQFVKTNNHGNYSVSTEDNSTFLNANFSTMSTLTPSGKASPYIETIKTILFKKLSLTNKEILVVGAGGFSLSAESTFGNHFTYIDIDGDIKLIAEKNLLNGPIKGDFITSDARSYFSRKKKKYDVIISDAYRNANNLPVSLLTQEYYLEVYDHLKLGGLAVFNIIAQPFFDNRFSKTTDNTLSSIFKNCVKYPLSFEKEVANIIYLCKRTTNEGLTTLYTDNLNRASLDQYQAKKF